MTKIRKVTVHVQGEEIPTPTGMLLLAAHTVFTADYEVTAAQEANARKLMKGILEAARQAGYRKTDKLRKVLKADNTSALALTLAQKACDIIPAERLNLILLQSHQEAAAGAWICRQHGAYGAFVGAGDAIVMVAEPPSGGHRLGDRSQG